MAMAAKRRRRQGPWGFTFDETHLVTDFPGIVVAEYGKSSTY